jgi:radical SAM superfamily enzyme YgiQ (UPF0313 family)
MGSMDICLVTLNSTYQHAAFGLRYLQANLKQYQTRSEILEFTIHRKASEIVDEILKRNPRIVGFGVYIWNTTETLPVITQLKARAPEILVVLGGPEVSFESESQKICQQADFVLKGEADFLFHQFCDEILSLGTKPLNKFISGPLPEISQIQSPYGLYSDNDIKNRVVYVEASRGCPYKCEYCLSSLDKSVRNFSLDGFLADMKMLLDKGVRQFKFIDRTFNLSPKISCQILQFFLNHIELGLFLHFEMVPDRLPQEIKDLIKQFPEGSLQFEIGIQTLNPAVAALVSRKNDLKKVEENFKFLKEHTHVHTHADLIAGLPGETLESFALGFEKLLSWRPDEIQLGILKRLKGTPIIRHDKEWEMVYSDKAPFQVLSTKTMNSETLEKLHRFSRFWDQINNSGRFKNTMSHLLNQEDFFFKFMELADFLFKRFERTHSIHLRDLAQAVEEFTGVLEISVESKSAAHMPKRQSQHLVLN